MAFDRNFAHCVRVCVPYFVIGRNVSFSPSVFRRHSHLKASLINNDNDVLKTEVAVSVSR